MKTAEETNLCLKTGLHRFPSFAEAANSRKSSGGSSPVFKCDYCQWWHVGESVKKTVVR